VLEWRGFLKGPFLRKMVNLGIVVVNYNTRDLLRTCLHSVYASQGDFTFDVCVVDNGSPDSSAEMVAAEFPQRRTSATPAPTTRGWQSLASRNPKLQIPNPKCLVLRCS
jgi:GT2 family glycosyltransferase